MTNRRAFIKKSSFFTLASLVPGLSIYSAPVFAQTTDYKALVCLFLYGGNDGNNMVIPYSNAGYASYATARGSQANGGLALAKNTLIPLQDAFGQANYALHPGLSPLQQIWQSGQLALLFNAGPLVAPLTRAQYLANAPVPQNLFSHADQQIQWQAAGSSSLAHSGWGGRMADRLDNNAIVLPPMITVATNALFASGNRAQPVTVPASGGLTVNGFQKTVGDTARYLALQQLISAGLTSSDALVAAEAAIQADTLSVASTLNPVLSTTSNVLGAIFSKLTDSLSTQLLAVAKLIESRTKMAAPARQIFFVSLGGFDTHTDQINRQQTLLSQVGNAVAAFYQATVALGVAGQVTTFTMSDFARTLKPNSTRGSDHAWGNHHLIIGGAVKGGFYGSFPSLVLGANDDAGTEGRWIPTTSVEEYGATLATWFGYGANAADMLYAFPQLAKFAPVNLGFV